MYLSSTIYQLSISQSTIYKRKMLLAATIWLYLCTNYTFAIQSGRLMAPASITALSGDLHVQLQLFNNVKTLNSTNNHAEATTNSLVISKYITAKKSLEKSKIEKIFIQSIPVFPDPRENVTQITVPCETFAWAGTYEMQFVTNLKTNISLIQQNQTNNISTHLVTTTLMPLHDERLHQLLDVRWPRAYIQLSHTRLSTYPETIVHATLSFREGHCENAFNASDMPEFWLELVYCGRDSTCSKMTGSNVSKTSIFYAEQVRGFPTEQNFTLNCELFGLAGIYAVQLRPMQYEILSNFPMTRRFINVDWSEKFVFNVFARSIFPCDPHTGIGVLFEYPHCILEQSDRVRVYAKLRADVASLKPPTSLHYVAEQRVVKNQHSLHFSCEIFSEKYVEYCFVYVSQALTGAVADVRMDCVPTLPVSDSDTGGWGPWSEWTPCSTNCLGGTRNRYRFCDSPPPRYGAKFCEGPSVETQKCNATNIDKTNCIYVSNFSTLDNNENNGIVGPGCRCGCIVHIGSSRQPRVIASVLQNCPGKSYWLIQADMRKRITLSFKFIRLPCASQYIKVRNGPSLSSKLLNEIQSNEFIELPAGIESTDSQLLLEIYAGDQITSFAKENNNSQNNLINLHCNGGFSLQIQETAENKTTTMVASTKQLFKTREIKRIITRSGLSLVHIIVIIFASIIILISTFLGIQFIIRYQKYHLALAQNCEDGLCLQPPLGNISLNSLNRLPSRAVSTTTLLSEVICLVKMRSKPNVRHTILRESLDAEFLHKQTAINDETLKLEKNIREDEENIKQSAELKLINTVTSADSTLTVQNIDETAPTGQLFVVDIHTDTSNSQMEKNQTESMDSLSLSTSCNSASALESSLEILKHRKETMKLKKLLAKKDEISLDISSGSSCSVSRSNIISLTHAQFSPYKNCMSLAATRLKEKKDKQNRKKLLSRPNSDMSLGHHDSELEMDYYDYDVINAAAVPGSYFSMDPAHLIWIPPFDVDEENLDNQEILSKLAEFHSSTEINKSEPFYKELKLNRYRNYFWPQSSSEDSITPTNTNTSNTAATTPTSFKLLSALNKSSLLINPVTPSKANNLKNTFVQQTICAGVPNQLSYCELNKQLKSTRSLYNINQKDLQELHAFKSERNFVLNSQDLQNSDDSYMEKETNVVKSQSDLQSYLAVNDILFADDTEGEYDV